ncbi:MAG: tetratricopeptide repeat protein [Nitrospirae bacterium]|nr:tetratricopeptide repeat protein [Nitrospirota bacterium]
MKIILSKCLLGLLIILLLCIVRLIAPVHQQQSTPQKIVTKELTKSVKSVQIKTDSVTHSSNLITYRQVLPSEIEPKSFEYLQNIILQSNWENTEVIKYLCDWYMANGMLDDAVYLLRRAIDMNGDAYDLYVKLAYVLNLRNDTAEAEDILLKVITINPTYSDAIETYRVLLQNTNNDSKYINFMNQLIQENPNAQELYVLLASSYRNNADDNSAEQVYRDGIQHNQNEPELKKALADLLLNTTRIEEATDLYKQYIEFKPDDPYGYLQLGNIYYKLGDYTQAKLYYEKTISISPDYNEEIDRILHPVNM